MVTRRYHHLKGKIIKINITLELNTPPVELTKEEINKAVRAVIPLMYEFAPLDVKNLIVRVH